MGLCQQRRLRYCYSCWSIGFLLLSRYCHAAVPLVCKNNHDNDNDSSSSSSSSSFVGLIFANANRPKDITVIANIPPPFRQGETKEGRDRIDAILYHHWSRKAGVDRSGYYYYYDNNQTNNRNGLEFTYGEVSPLGVRQLAHYMNLHGNTTTKDVIFFDVGSGVGKLVVQLYLENIVDRAIGIESCPIRHGIATTVWSDIQDEFTTTNHHHHHHPKPHVEFINQDARVADLSLATHVFISSLCFPKDLTDHISRLLLDSAPNLQVVAALSALQDFDSRSSSWRKKTFDIQTTWGRSRVHIYYYYYDSRHNQQQQ